MRPNSYCPRAGPAQALAGPDPASPEHRARVRGQVGAGNSGGRRDEGEVTAELWCGCHTVNPAMRSQTEPDRDTAGTGTAFWKVGSKPS